MSSHLVQPFTISGKEEVVQTAKDKEPESALKVPTSRGQVLKGGRFVHTQTTFVSLTDYSYYLGGGE